MGQQFYEVNGQGNMTSSFSDTLQWQDLEEVSIMENSNDSFAPIPLAHTEAEHDSDNHSDNVLKLHYDNKDVINCGTKDVHDNRLCFAHRKVRNDSYSEEKETSDDIAAYSCSPMFYTMPQEIEGIPGHFPEAILENCETLPTLTATTGGGSYQLPTSYTRDFTCIDRKVVDTRDQISHDRNWYSENGDKAKRTSSHPLRPAVSRRGRSISRLGGNAICGADYHQANNRSLNPETKLFLNPMQHCSYFIPQNHHQTHHLAARLGESDASGQQSTSFLLGPAQSTSIVNSPTSLPEIVNINQAPDLTLRHPPITEQMQRMHKIAHHNSMVQLGVWEQNPHRLPQPYTISQSVESPSVAIHSQALDSKKINILDATRRSNCSDTSRTQLLNGFKTITNEELQHATHTTAPLQEVAIGNISAATSSSNDDHGGGDDDKKQQLVLEEDKCLLTDYNFFMMKQLSLCQLTEADKKIRGGKRENIAIAFPGLQCIHCAEASNPRKFFWKNVDRLSNSFVEIPLHVLKCKGCPQQAKDALLRLKLIHQEQMAQLPRGSQKIFFRRVWRRMHSGCGRINCENVSASVSKMPEAAKAAEKVKLAPQKKKPKAMGEELVSALNGTKKGVKKASVASAQTEASLSSSQKLFVDKSGAISAVSICTVQEAANALANSAKQALLSPSPPPLLPSQRVLLASPEDKKMVVRY